MGDISSWGGGVQSNRPRHARSLASVKLSTLEANSLLSFTNERKKMGGGDCSEQKEEEDEDSVHQGLKLQLKPSNHHCC